mgnify:CR=1 FL=1
MAGRCGLFQLLVAVAGSCGWLRSLVAFAGGLGAGRFTRVPPAQTQNEMAVPLSQVILCPNQLVGGWSAACSCAQGAVIRRLLSPGATESRMGDVGDSDDLEPEEELGRIWIPGRDDGGSGTNTTDLRRLQGHRDADIEVARGTFKTLLKEVDAARLDTGQAKRITKAAAAMDKLKQLQSQFVQSAASVDPAKWEKALTLQYRKAQRAIGATKSGGGSKGEPRARGSAAENITDMTDSEFWHCRSPEEAEAAVLVLLAQNKDTAFETAATFYTGSPDSTSRLVRALAEAKAEVGARDNQGQRALQVALENLLPPADQVTPVLHRLLELKADLLAADAGGHTPLDASRGYPTEALLMEHLAKQQSADAVSTSHSAAESSSVAQTLAASDAAELSTTTESAQHSGAASLPGALTSADLPPPRKRKLDSDASGRKRVGQGLKSEVKADMEAEPAEAGESHP